MSTTKIMIDPGHGGKDPGAVSAGVEEKQLTLTIARHIAEQLKRIHGLDVRLTRDTDTYLSLTERIRLANSWKADYFLSIHINAGGGSGFESFIYPKAGPHTAIYQSAIHQHVAVAAGRGDRGMKQANFAVLRETKMPALLTENLFIDHLVDSRILGSPAMLKRIAASHVNGFKRLLKLGDAAVGSAPATRTYRVLINGKQIGAYAEKDNVYNQVKKHLGTNTHIEIKPV
ncbi:N-acetylmuramoyl-L-alanine amidase family protein [Bacillus piscicola]|uniref:N-acetylmuramoyl-L-alanine amidase family protein n=1 Tax=Bacillus piscicola TaxID=1632684 RepID=UPI001F095DAF|nr:N-acetylmuramoyl-L-alanine amidase [Bacillus piscicola]